MILPLLESILPGWISEYTFGKLVGRQWRFDFAHMGEMIAVEVNGNAWRTQGGGRHGKVGDLQKINCAQALGWRVLQYTTHPNELARLRTELLYILAERHGGKFDPYCWRKL